MRWSVSNAQENQGRSFTLASPGRTSYLTGRQSDSAEVECFRGGPLVERRKLGKPDFPKSPNVRQRLMFGAFRGGRADSTFPENALALTVRLPTVHLTRAGALASLRSRAVCLAG